MLREGVDDFECEVGGGSDVAGGSDSGELREPRRSEFRHGPGAGDIQPVGLLAIRRDVTPIDGTEKVGQCLWCVGPLEEHGEIAQGCHLLGRVRDVQPVAHCLTEGVERFVGVADSGSQ